MQQLLDQKQQPRGVVFRIVEDIFLLCALFHCLRLERRPEIAGGHAIKSMRCFAEALAQAARWKGEQSADGFNAELKKYIAELGFDIQTIERYRVCAAALFGGIAKDRNPFFRFGDGVTAEAREAERKIRRESLDAQIFMYGVSPFQRRSIETLQAGAVQPKDARLFSRWLNFRSKPPERMSKTIKVFFTYS